MITENIQIHQSPKDMNFLFGMLKFEAPSVEGFDMHPEELAKALDFWVDEEIAHQVNGSWESDKTQIFFVEERMAELVARASMKVHIHLMDVAEDLPNDEEAKNKAYWGRVFTFPWVEAVELHDGKMTMEQAKEMRESFHVPPRFEFGSWDKELEAN